jgi:serine/threonine protein kinase
LNFNPGDSFGIGKYRLEKTIGDGSDAQVWLAYEHSIQRYVVIKILRQNKFDVGARHRFEVEARALAAINHDGVIKLLEYSSESDAPSYMVLDHGGTNTLLNCIEGDCEIFNNMSSRERLAKLNVVVAGLSAAHTNAKHKIVHCDIKPNNILWDGNRFRLCDFGRCSIDDVSGGDISGQFIGNFVNPAPEQFFEHPVVTTETDVFNMVGAIYSALTGDSVYREPGLFGTQAAAVAGKIVWGKRFKALDKPLRAILEVGLKYFREERFSNAGPLHADINCYLNHEKVSVSIESPYQKLGRWIKRYPWPTALLFSSLIVAALMTIIAYQAQVNKRQTEQVLYAFGGVLGAINPLQPIKLQIAESAYLDELFDMLQGATSVDSPLRATLFIDLGARYMALDRFSEARDAYTAALTIVSDPLATINLAWSLRELGHAATGPSDVIPDIDALTAGVPNIVAIDIRATALYEEALKILLPLKNRQYPSHDPHEDFITLLARNRYATVLMFANNDKLRLSEAEKLFREIDMQLAEQNSIEPWLRPVNMGNLATYMAKQERYDEALRYHKESEGLFEEAGLMLHPEVFFAYVGQSQQYHNLNQHSEGFEAMRSAIEHGRVLGRTFSEYYLLGLIELYKNYVNFGEGNYQDEKEELLNEFCRLMSDSRCEVGEASQLWAIHLKYCQ